MRALSVVFVLLFCMIPPLVTGSNVGLFESPAWGSNLTGVFHSSLVFGDIDNDGDQDLVIMGCSAGGVDYCTTADRLRIYSNDGSAYNEDHVWGINLTNLGYGSLALGDIDNDGDLDLTALGDAGGGNGIAKIYISNGTSFVESFTWQQNLSIDAYAGALALGDVNIDGRLDLILVGAYPASDNGVYINNGTSFQKNSAWLQLPYVGHGTGMGAMALGDVDNDGDLDIVFSGSFSTNFYDSVFLNNGTQFVEDAIWREDFRMLGWPSLALGDYDNDGDMDLAYMGTHGGDRFYTYNNNGMKFDEDPLIYGYFDGSVAWGDYDNDGDLDLAAMGKESGRNRVYENSNGSFLVDGSGKDLQSDNMQQGSLAFGDVDNDGNLDLVCSGYKYSDGYLSKVYINNLTASNTAPDPPISSYACNYTYGKLTMSWGNGIDSETPTAGLYYNLRVGTCSGCHDVVSGIFGGSSNPTAGYYGNMMQRKSITLNRYFEPGTKIYWAVQTIDTGLERSAWSTEQVYEIPGAEPPCEPEWSCSSWGSCQPDDTQTCNSWTDSNGCSVPYTGSNTRSCTYKSPSSSGGSSYIPPPPQHTFNLISPGTHVSKQLAEGVNVTISVKETVRNIDILVTERPDRPPSIIKEVEGRVYGYLEVNASGIEDADIQEAFIEFSVNRSWIDDNVIDVETVTLHRYQENAWQALNTEFLSSGDSHYNYQAKTPGFSVFAITGQEIVAPPLPICNNNSVCETDAGENEDNCPQDCVKAPQLLCNPESRRCSGDELQECNPTGVVWITKELCSHGCNPEKLKCNILPTGDGSWYFLIISVMAAAIIAVVYLAKKIKTGTPGQGF